MKRKIRRRECQACGKNDPSVKRRRQITAYADDKLNFSVLCSQCQKEANDYWKDRWDEYYSAIMDIL